jgi:hypothetical protein
VAPALRRQLRAADEREDAEPLALALGRCGDPGDGPRLLALLARWPASLPLAVAAARSGRGDDARARWIPPSPQTALDHACRDAAWVELARELASPKLGRRIRRAIARRRRGDPAATEGSTEVPIEAWLAHLGALGLSGLNPVDVARADGIQMRRPRNREALGAAGARWSVAHRADALAADIAAGGASMTAAIATVRDADIAVEQRPAPITRALLRRAARGSGSIDERAVALDALLGRHDDAHGYARHRLALRAAVAALDAAPDLPASIHARMANALVPPTGFSGVAEAVALWTWVSPRPVSERAALIATHVRHRDWSAAAIPYGMRRIEADATLRDALVSRYADAYADDPEGVLRTLNTAMSWMHPAIAEPWVADIAARIAADDVRERDLLTVLRDHDGQFSYRLQRLMTQCVIPRLPAAGQASLAAGIVEVRRGSWLRSIWPAHTSD